MAAEPPRRPWIVAAMALLAGITAVLADQPSLLGDEIDRVTFRSETGSGRISMRGRILKYRGDSITVESLPAGNVHTFPASRVIRVETSYTPFHLQGLEEFAAGRLDTAQAAFEQALNDETRDWARREILAMLVRCGVGRNDFAAAGSRFLLLVQSDPLTHHYHLIPLLWAPYTVDPELQNAGRLWIKGGSETARLLGSSVLLEETEDGLADDARIELHKLATSPDRRVQQLAQAQRLRLRLAKGRVSREELHSWESRIEAMPEPLRGGPYYLLGQAYLKLGEYERGATALLWLPLVYDQNNQLAARACVEAAEALAQVGQHDQSVALFQEVVIRFPGTEFAQRASAEIQPAEGRPQDSTSPPTADSAGQSSTVQP